MTDQVRISDDGSLEIERTWDGQPLWSTSTEQERLFASDAFQQMPGQLPIEEPWSVESGTEPPTQLLASVFGLGTRYFS